MARKSVCKNCNIELLKEEKYMHSSKSYCKHCYDAIQIKKNEYELLITTICEYLSIDKPTGLILKQIKDYIDKFGYTYNGITYCLWYIKAIENKTFNETKYGIAYVKYNYEKAKAYFEQQQKISNSVNEESYHEPRINEVKVNLNKVYSKKTDFLYDLNDLIGGST